jgi:hypothetical protein
MYQAGNLGQRIFKEAALLATHVRGLLPAVTPGYAVIAVKQTEAHTFARPSILVSSELPDKLQNVHPQPVLLTSGQDNGSRLIVLPFAPGGRQPAAVIKLSTLARLNHATESEQAILTKLASQLTGSLAETTPQPLGLFAYGSLAAGVETYAGGRPMSVTSGSWPGSLQRHTKNLDLAVHWLVEFQSQAPLSWRTWNSELIDVWIEEPLASYAATLETPTKLAQLFERVRREARSLVGEKLPFAPLHFDFGPWNIYVADQSCRVIDWEFGRNWSADRMGPAIYDLLYFATYWLYLAKRLDTKNAELRGFRLLFIEPNRKDAYVQAARQAISSYLTELRINPRFLPLMVVYLWVEQALYQATRKQNLGSSVSIQGKNQSIRYLHLIAKHPEPFFKNLDNLSTTKDATPCKKNQIPLN